MLCYVQCKHLAQLSGQPETKVYYSIMSSHVLRMTIWLDGQSLDSNIKSNNRKQWTYCEERYAAPNLMLHGVESMKLEQ